MQFLLHLPVFLHHLLRCKYGISCPSARHETELLFYTCLLPLPGMKPNGSSPMLVSSLFCRLFFPNLHGMRYHLDASIIHTILDVPLLFEDRSNHTVPPFLWHFLLLEYIPSGPIASPFFISSECHLYFSLLIAVWHSIAKYFPRVLSV